MIFKSKGEDEKRHRLIILTDMENEPDDSQTMVKLLMYSNEIDIEGLIAVTSIHLQRDVFPESIFVRVQAYGLVRPSLMKNAPGWPTEEYLLDRTAGGQRGYGMAAVGDGKSSAGSELIIRAVDKDDPRPVWIAINAGANTLAQALWDVKKSRTAEEVSKFVAKIRVYDDSGQDDAGAWIAHNFPEIFYIRSSYQVFGLFGPHEKAGPQSTYPLDHFDWAEQNIRTRHGILGALYPQRMFKQFNGNIFMEGGGTTTWLGLVNKGLFDPDELTWGGWGGRFSPVKEKVICGQSGCVELEKKQGDFLMYPQAADYSFHYEGEMLSECTGNDDAKYDWHYFAPLWRWRDDYLADFKARMDWCVADYEQTNHHPVIDLFGDTHRTIARFSASAGERCVFDLTGSYDPDHQTWKDNSPQGKLSFRAYMYPEAGTYDGTVEIIDGDTRKPTVIIPQDASGKQIHIILEAKDSDSQAPLKSYRRVVIDVDPA